MTSTAAPEAPEPPPLRPRHRLTAWAAGLLLIVPAVISACRFLDTDGITPVPQLLSLLPWLAVPAGLGVLLAAVARRRALTFLAVLVLGAVGWSSLPYMPQLVTSYGLPLAKIRVLAANVEFGQGTRALIDTVGRERPQLVFVSECDRACGRALTTAFAAELPHHTSVDAEGSVGSGVTRRHRRRLPDADLQHRRAAALRRPRRHRSAPSCSATAGSPSPSSPSSRSSPE
ncbi:hypothetical protein SNARM312S_01882 [Streptomyces narbonensis]